MTLGKEQIEKSVLGTMLKENYLIGNGGVKKEFFMSQIHQNIFSCMQTLAQSNRPVDYVTLLTMMNPAELGGANYLAELSAYAAATKFDSYVEVMLEGWKKQTKDHILITAKQEDWSIGDIQNTFDRLEKEGAAGLETSIKQELVSMGERPYEEQVEEYGVTTGLKDLDRMLNGFQPSELIIIAARPSMGKTDTLNKFALSAGHAGYKPIIFSLEMSKVSMVDRLIASTGGFNRLRMRNPHKYFTEEQKKRWLPTLARLDQANINIDERAGLRVSQMRATARKIINSAPNLKPIIFVDYLQIIAGEDPRRNRTEVVGQISNDLKQMAKEFNCPVVCLSQLSRGVESRDNKRPIMSDLRDSGNIEQDADVIAFLYRDDYYNKDSETQNILEIIISKHRNGPTGTVTVAYTKETGVLTNIDWQAGSAV